jgi:hypothetical protein
VTTFDEQAWWGDCANTFHEEEKQLVYAERLGLRADWGGGHPPTFDLDGRSVLDIGGGPTSLLLKCQNFKCAVVLDPGLWPEWVEARYLEHGVSYVRTAAEGWAPDRVYDEVWIYNTLQHVGDPAEVIAVARIAGKLIRLFEWIDIPPYPGHPHLLTEAFLNHVLDDSGFVAELDERGAVGRAYYGVFSTESRATLGGGP